MWSGLCFSVITISIIVGRNSYVALWNKVFGVHKDNCQCNLTTHLVTLQDFVCQLGQNFTQIFPMQEL